MTISPVSAPSLRYAKVFFILVGAAALASRASASLGPAADYAVQTGPSMIAAADLNGDTFRDLVVTNALGSSVSVLLGNASGGFGAATHFPILTGPGRRASSVAISDLNGDTFPDLVVGTGGVGLSSTVQVLLGDGTGSFGTATTFSAGSDPWAVATGDFTGDGKIDIASANRNSDNVSILPGNGDGTFGGATTYPVGAFPTTITAGDLNGDGRPDLVTTNANSDNISVLLADGAGSFQAAVNYAVGFYPFGVAIGRLNGDASPDLAVADSESVFVLINNGSGVFGVATSFPTGDGAGAVAIGDLNNDNRADLAVANYFADTITVLTGNGAGSFGSAVDFPADEPNWVIIERFGSDALPDLAYVNGGLNTATVRLNTTPPATAKIGRMTVRGPATGKAGKKATFKVKITNTGNAAATGVALKAGGPGIRFNATVGTIAAGETKTVTVKLKPKKTGPIQATFTATSSNAGSKRVRP